MIASTSWPFHASIHLRANSFACDSVSMAIAERLLCGQLAIDLSELVEPGLADEPFGGSNRTIGEAATVLGIVDEHHRIVRRIKQDHVRSDRFAFADRSDLGLHVAHVGKDLLNRDCRA